MINLVRLIVNIGIKALILSWCFLFFFSNVNATNDSIKFSENKTLYIVMFDDPVRLLKLDFQDEYPEFFEIQTFDVEEVDRFSIFEDYNIFILRTSDDPIPGDYRTLNIMSIKEPWTIAKYESYYLEFFYPYKIKSNNYLISLKYNKTEENYKFKPKAKLISLENGDEKDISLNKLKNINYKEWLIVRNNKLFFRRMGLDHLEFPYSPPEEMLEDLEDMHLIANTDDHVILSHPYHEKNTWIYIYAKLSKQWDKYLVEGDQSLINVINDYVISKTGFVPEVGSRTNYTGKYEFINLENRKRQNIKLEESGEIFIIKDDFLIAKSNNRIVYIPIKNNQILEDKKQILYDDNTDKKEEVGALQRVAFMTQAAFIGPKKIPEEVKLKRARELNVTGEEYYHNTPWHYDKAIYYFREAVKFDPEYAQAYSNLGLAYYAREKNYDKSIEYSLKAVELAKDDTVKATSYFNIAKSFEALEEWDNAMTHYKKALEFRKHDSYKDGIERMKKKITN